MQFGNGYGKHPGRILGQLWQRGDVLGQVVGDVVILDVDRQPLDQAIHHVARRRLADQLGAVGGNDGGALCPGEIQIDLGQLQQSLADAVAVGHGREHLHHGLTQRQSTIGFRVGLGGIDLQRQHPTEQLAGGPRLEGYPLRLAIVTEHQSPETAADHDGNRHGGQGAHVSHVLQVHRRHAAQLREAEVERLAGQRIGLRLQRRRLVVGVADHPDAVGQVQAAGLGRDVRGGKSQPQIAGYAGIALLGQHLSVTFFVEAIDHGVVEAGDALGFAHRERGDGIHGFGLVQLLDEHPHHGIEGIEAEPAVHRRLEFDDQHPTEAMHEQREGLLLRPQGDVALIDGILLFLGQSPEHGRQIAPRQQFAKRATQYILHGDAKVLAHVGAGLDNAQIRLFHGEQEAMFLDTAGNVDRLIGTIGQSVGLRLGR